MNNASSKLKVGVVGCGVGVAHIQAYLNLPEQFEIVAICDIDEVKGQDIAAKHGDIRFYKDIDELCRVDDVDVVDICTPSYQHFTQTQQVLAAGKHVICEKPIAGSLKKVDELMLAEARSGKLVMPIFQYRFGHGAQKLKFLISEGVAGRAYLTTVEIAWRRRAQYYDVQWRGKWKTELGGPLVTLAIHAYDLLYYILGPAKIVFAQAKTLVNPIETEDCVSASMEMADGSLASLLVTTGSAAEISRYRFCFSGISAESNTQPYDNTADPWIFIGDTPEKMKQIEETLARFRPQSEGYVGQFRRFYQTVQHGSPCPVTLADARAALELTTALYTSIQTGQAITLPISKEHPKYAGWQP